MRVKFWSDTNQSGFVDVVEAATGHKLEAHNLYEYEIPEELASMAMDWGATEVENTDA